MAKKHYGEQFRYTNEILIPYLRKHIDFITVVDVGCGEGGSLKAFNENGYKPKGLEIAKDRIMDNNIIHGDATVSIPKADLIIMRDVIEHIENKKKLLNNVKSKYLFITFPPKCSTYAAHQQNYSYWKYIPYANLFKKFEVMTTALSIKRFEKLTRDDYKVIDKQFYLFRPVFKIRFGLPVVRIPKLFFATGAEFLLEKL